MVELANGALDSDEMEIAVPMEITDDSVADELANGALDSDKMEIAVPVEITDGSVAD